MRWQSGQSGGPKAVWRTRWGFPWSWRQALALGLGSLGWVVVMGTPGGLRAEVNPHLLPSLEPLDLSVFQQSGHIACPDSPPPGTVKTALTICDSRLTDPSLWWAKQLYGDRLVDNWLTYVGNDREPGRVDVVVNPEVWNTWNYLERYSFLDRFGGAAQRQGYNVRVFDWQSRLLAAYTCDFDGWATGWTVDRRLTPDPLEPGITDRPNGNRSAVACQVLLNPSGRSALRGRSPVAPNATPND